MLDKDLAAFYGIEVRVFNQARKRNQDHFLDNTFQLNKEEWAEALKIQGLPPQRGGHPPWAFTEDAVYWMAFHLKSDTGKRLAKLILDVFVSVRDRSFIPIDHSNKPLQIAHRIQEVERERTGENVVVHNHHYYAPVTQVVGNHGQVQIGSSEDLIKELLSAMMNPVVLQNQELLGLLSKSVTQANKKDKKALLDTLAQVVDIGSKSAPAILSLLEMARKIHF